MTERDLACLILAAGKGTRMKSARPKVLHRLAGRALVAHVVGIAEAAGATRIGVVVGPGMPDVEGAVAPRPVAVQHRQAGTGDAVKAGLPLLEGFAGDVVVLYGDTPLVRPETIAAMVAKRRATGAAVTVLGFRPADPAQYGRLVIGADGGLDAIVEFADADAAQRAIGLCNGGIMAFDGARLGALLGRLGNANAKGEFYLTDTVALARAEGWSCAVVEADAEEVLGVNSRLDLAEAEAVLQGRLRRGAMLGGATLLDPASTFLSADTRLGQDVTIGPSTLFGPGVTIEDEVEILGFCHLEGAVVRRGARIGPFARLRPGTVVEEGAHVGNFVELKAARLGPGAKANHLAYIGDAEVGARANIGAGAITCNYDGFVKSRTVIGADAFIGTNAALVAPVTIGAGAIIGAGSTIVRDVPDDTLAVARARQEDRVGAAKFYRAKRQAAKDAAQGPGKKG